ncbi:hypothetical protein OCU04_012331 [Sclerotinia nivalis]|uniref:MmgE/PrpD C-terminal domain-containing protein n=1 Tax=Sclerotinia nivalis TaxID=352851 RepID=A0A9X0AAW5_9HELO|nr:hypothetical protein OCU04_012331 [Sclerotinia nivalis]
MEGTGFNTKDIKSIHARVHPLVLELTRKENPRDRLEGKFSVYHGAVVGLLCGSETPSQYEDHRFQREEVIFIRDKVDVVADSSLGADEAIIIIIRENGEEFQKDVKHAVGSLGVPMDDKMLQQKIEGQCIGVLCGSARKASAAC